MTGLGLVSRVGTVCAIQLGPMTLTVEKNVGAATEPKTRHRILVVDDDPSVREMLPRVLEGEGYEALSASSGEEAVAIVGAARVDLVLLDLKLRGQSGWHTFQQLVAQDPMLSVIIITAGPGQLFAALGFGAGALLEKPLDFPRLLQTIRDLLEEPEAARMARVEGRRAQFHYLPATPQKPPKLGRRFSQFNGAGRI